MLRKTRRVCAALIRFGKLHMPKWMLVVVAACAVIPGPFDEAIVFPVLLVLVLRTKRNRVVLKRYMRVAVHG
jgi:hypothetical protein